MFYNVDIWNVMHACSELCGFICPILDDDDAAAPLLWGEFTGWKSVDDMLGPWGDVCGHCHHGGFPEGTCPWYHAWGMYWWWVTHSVWERRFVALRAPEGACPFLAEEVIGPC